MKDIEVGCLRKFLYRIFRPKGDECIQGWRKLYNEGLCSLCYTKYRYDNQIKDRQAEHRAPENSRSALQIKI
jgi:hypothetical protein